MGVEAPERREPVELVIRHYDFVLDQIVYRVNIPFVRNVAREGGADSHYFVRAAEVQVAQERAFFNVKRFDIASNGVVDLLHVDAFSEYVNASRIRADSLC